MSKPFMSYPTTFISMSKQESRIRFNEFGKCIQSRLMIYLTGSNPGVGLHVLDVHRIWCEYDFLFSAKIHHLIHGEKIDGNFGNV